MSKPGRKQSVIVAMTGASGAAYAARLIQRLAALDVFQHILLSDAARVVLKQEMDIMLDDSTESRGKDLCRHLGVAEQKLRCYALDDWFSPAASGSAGIRKMVIIPCSMGALSRIAHGASDNLIERAADVMLKEHGRLILVPRETPLSSIHLENMLRLSRMGAHIIPAMPGFYHRPKSIDDLIDFIVDRVLDHLGYDDIPDARSWGE